MKKLKTIDIIKSLTDICKKLDELDDYIDSLPELHSEMDLRMSDLYHTIEMHELNTTQAKKLIDEIQTVCNNRRIVKIQLDYARSFRDNIGKLLQKGNRQILLSRLNTLVKQKATPEYTYRIYNDTEINKLLGVRKPKEVKKDVEDKGQSTKDM